MRPHSIVCVGGWVGVQSYVFFGTEEKQQCVLGRCSYICLYRGIDLVEGKAVFS